MASALVRISSSVNSARSNLFRRVLCRSSLPSFTPAVFVPCSLSSSGVTFRQPPSSVRSHTHTTSPLSQLHSPAKTGGYVGSTRCMSILRSHPPTPNEAKPAHTASITTSSTVELAEELTQWKDFLHRNGLKLDISSPDIERFIHKFLSHITGSDESDDKLYWFLYNYLRDMDPSVSEYIIKIYSLAGLEMIIDVCCFGQEHLQVVVDQGILLIDGKTKDIMGKEKNITKKIPIVEAGDMIAYHPEKVRAETLKGQLRVVFPFEKFEDQKKAEEKFTVKWIEKG